MNKVPITVRGAQKLQDELLQLKTVDRPKVIEDIATAREHGDLKENAEYHAAREQQGFIEGRIKDIEGKLGNATIIDVTTVNANGKVVFGATVDVADEETGDEMSYQIVGEDEADAREGRISLSSPIARGLIGKEEGDVADVQTPGGVKSFEIVEVLEDGLSRVERLGPPGLFGQTVESFFDFGLQSDGKHGNYFRRIYLYSKL